MTAIFKPGDPVNWSGKEVGVIESVVETRPGCFSVTMEITNPEFTELMGTNSVGVSVTEA